MRIVNKEELDWIEQDDQPYADLFAFLRSTLGWIHLGLDDLPASGGLQAKKNALLDEAEERGLAIRVKVRPGNPAGGIFVFVR